MTLHLTNARLIDPESLTETEGALTVENGLITALNAPAPKGATTFDCGAKCLAPGIVDIGVKVGEPGETHRSILIRAMAGVGFLNYPWEWWHWSWGDQYWAHQSGSACAHYGSIDLGEAASRAPTGV